MTRLNAGNLSHRPATREYLIAYYGTPPRETTKAIVFFEGDKLVAIGGLKRELGRWVAFSEIKPDATLTKRTIWKCAQVVMDLIRKATVPVWAVAEYKGEATGILIKRLGFEYQTSLKDGEVYVLWPTR